MTGRRLLGILVLRGALGIGVGAALVYAVDAAILRWRVATNRDAFGTVTVHPYYAMDRKDKRTEFVYEDAREEKCVKALFPHLGDKPCWYLQGHRDERDE